MRMFVLLVVVLAVIASGLFVNVGAAHAADCTSAVPGWYREVPATGATSCWGRSRSEDVLIPVGDPGYVVIDRAWTDGGLIVVSVPGPVYPDAVTTKGR